METYSVIVRNEQGASDAKSGLTQRQVDAYLSSWSDPENLSVEVKDEGGETVATKPRGETAITW